jgi:DNA-binding CsgD family transcriptional regulator
MELPLTKREKEVYDLLLDGLGLEEIAEKMFVEKGTIQGHLKNIYKKKKVKSFRELLSQEVKKFRHIISRYETNALKIFDSMQDMTEQILKLKADNEKLNVMLGIRDKQIERLTDGRIKNEVRGRNQNVYQNFTESKN